MKALLLGCTLSLAVPAQTSHPLLPHNKESRVEDQLRSFIKDERNPAESEVDETTLWLQSQGRKGIWILTPKTLDLGTDDETKIVGWDYYDKQPRGYRYVKSEGVVIATRVESRETVGGPVQPLKDPGPAPSNELPPIEPGENLLTFHFNLRERLPSLPWRAGTYIVDVLLDGQTSNRLQFTLTPGKAAERDPAIAKFIEEQRNKTANQYAFVPSLAEVASYPSGHDANTSPALPQEQGIALAVDRVSVYQSGAKNILRGSFRLAVPASFLRPGEAGAPVAAVPITLVITGNDLVGPFVAPLYVPTYEAFNKEAAESVVTGQFAVDLFALKETSKVIQTYTIWAYSGAIRSEPVKNAVITPDMMH